MVTWLCWGCFANKFHVVCFGLSRSLLLLCFVFWGVGRPSWASPRPNQNYWRWFLHVQTWSSNTNTVVFEIKRCMCIIFLRMEDFYGFWFNVYQFILWAQQNEALKSHFPRVSLIEWSFKHWRFGGSLIGMTIETVALWQLLHLEHAWIYDGNFRYIFTALWCNMM